MLLSSLLCLLLHLGAMAYDLTSDKIFVAINDIREADYKMYFTLTLKALETDQDSIEKMSYVISVQHEDILRKVLEFIGGYLPRHESSVVADALIKAHLHIRATAFSCVHGITRTSFLTAALLISRCCLGSVQGYHLRIN